MALRSVGPPPVITRTSGSHLLSHSGPPHGRFPERSSSGHPANARLGKEGNYLQMRIPPVLGESPHLKASLEDGTAPRPCHVTPASLSRPAREDSIQRGGLQEASSRPGPPEHEPGPLLPYQDPHPSCQRQFGCGHRPPIPHHIFTPHGGQDTSGPLFSLDESQSLLSIGFCVLRLFQLRGICLVC